MENKKIYIWLCLCLLLPAIEVVAQADDEVYIKENRRMEGNKLVPPAKINDCLAFYSDRDDTTRPKFRSVTKTQYAYKDTSFRGKRFESKEILTFNKMGQNLFYLKTDSLGIDDSMRSVYDDRYNKISDMNYNRNDSGRMVNNTRNTWEFDGKGRLIKYHNISNLGQYNSSDDMQEMKYYSWGAELKDISISGKDTTIELTRYDTAGRESYDEKNNIGDYTSREYWKYDSKDHVLLDKRAWKFDSSLTEYTYDEKGRLLGSREIHKGIPLDVITWHYNNDSSSTEVEEKTPENTGMSCPDDSRIVTMYDKAGRVLSEVMTKLQDGKPFTRSTIHKLSFDAKGNLLADTAVLTVQGYLYSSWSVSFVQWKYDEHGHSTEVVRGGGGDNDYQEKSTWTYNDQDKPLEFAQYNSCDATKPTNGTKRVYYPGGIKLQKMYNYNLSYGFYGTTYYDSNSRLTEDKCGGTHNYEVLYEYEK
jgi:hypothetical protein